MNEFMKHFESQCYMLHLATGDTPRGSPQKSPLKGGGDVVLRRTAGPPPLSASHSPAFNGGAGEVCDSQLSASKTCHRSPNRHSEFSDRHISGPKNRKSFFRRFSFRGIRHQMKPFKQLFKQHSDESELSHSSSFNGSGCDTLHIHNKKPKHGHDKIKMTKMLVECKKEGIVNQLVDEDFNGVTKWDKCRLVLIKTTGGYMLEFYTPPKVSIILHVQNHI